jgi:hypothetical protein
VPDKKMIIYRTSDLYFAGYLSAIDIEMVTAEEDRGSDGKRKLVFVFKVPEADLPRLKASYFAGHGTVKVKRYVDSIRSLKSLCYV